jgi:2-methylcitrate dehydratase PrpD
MCFRTPTISWAVDASVPKKNVHTEEDANHSLRYLLSVAILDGNVQPAQLEPSRIAMPDVQELLQKVRAKPDARFTSRYPAEILSQATVRLKSGHSFTHEVSASPSDLEPTLYLVRDRGVGMFQFPWAAR